MNKTNISAVLTIAFSLATAELAEAESASMEKCKIIGSDGKGLIKAGMTDCAGKVTSCAGSNEDGDPNAWIYVPKGICEKIKGGCLAN